MKYKSPRYSQFEEDINGNPISFNIKQSFNSHKERRKKNGAIVIFSNIAENGTVINPTVALNARVAISQPANNELLNLLDIEQGLQEVLPDMEVHLSNIRISM